MIHQRIFKEEEYISADYNDNIVICDSQSDGANNKTEEQTESNKKRKPSKRKADAEINEVFAKTMNQCVEAVRELASQPCPVEKEKNYISMALQLIEKRILDAKVPPSVAMKIENKLFLLVEQELKEYSESQ